MTNAEFGQGVGTILLDDVKCNGLEYRLFDCAHAGLDISNCDHHQDAGVVCVEGKMQQLLLSWWKCDVP